MPKPVRKHSFEKAPQQPVKGSVLGYGRVSREGQDLAQQRAALRAAGCGRLFEEKASGGRWDRPELHRLLDHLRPGDGTRAAGTYAATMCPGPASGCL